MRKLAGEGEAIQRRLTAILAADVAGYSRLMGADEEGTHERFKAHLRELIEPKIAEHRGRVVKNTGDGFLAEFASVVDAVRCAVEVQRGMAERNAGTPPEKRIEFRIGINLSDVIAEAEDIFGDGVNVAARLEGLAEPGAVLVSHTVHDHVRDRLPFGFEDLGEQQVKNIARPVRAWRIRLDGQPALCAPRVLTTASSLPDEVLYVMGTTIRAYTVDARFLKTAIPHVQTVRVSSGSQTTETLITTVPYIFELADKTHRPIPLTNFPLPFADGVRVTFLFYEVNEKEILFSVYNHLDPRWIEFPSGAKIDLTNDKERKRFAAAILTLALIMLALNILAIRFWSKEGSVVQLVSFVPLGLVACVGAARERLRKKRLISSMRHLQDRVEFR